MRMLREFDKIYGVIIGRDTFGFVLCSFCYWDKGDSTVINRTVCIGKKGV